MALVNFNDLARGTTSNKALRDKTFNTASNPAYDGYQQVIASIVYRLAYKKTIQNEADIHEDKTDTAASTLNQYLTGELYNLVIRKF